MSMPTREERKWLKLGEDCGGMVFGSTKLIIDAGPLLKFVEAIRTEARAELLKQQVRT